MLLPCFAVLVTSWDRNRSWRWGKRWHWDWPELGLALAGTTEAHFVNVHVDVVLLDTAAGCSSSSSPACPRTSWHWDWHWDRNWHTGNGAGTTQCQHSSFSSPERTSSCPSASSCSCPSASSCSCPSSCSCSCPTPSASSCSCPRPVPRRHRLLRGCRGLLQHPSLPLVIATS
jgi:hypothetical protein